MLASCEDHVSDLAVSTAQMTVSVSWRHHRVLYHPWPWLTGVSCAHNREFLHDHMGSPLLYEGQSHTHPNILPLSEITLFQCMTIGVLKSKSYPPTLFCPQWKPVIKPNVRNITNLVLLLAFMKDFSQICYSKVNHIFIPAYCYYQK